MLRLLSLIPAFKPIRTSGTPAGMRGESVPSIRVSTIAQEPDCTVQSGRPAKQAKSSTRFRLMLACLCLTLLTQLLPCASMAATLPGTNIDNTATATFSGTETVDSNLVRITTVVKRTPSTITFLQYAPTDPAAATINIPATSFSTTGDLENPLPSGTVGDYDGYYQLPAANPVVPASIFHGGQPLIIKLKDLDQNLDPEVAEQVWIRITSSVDNGSIDEELLLLTEDGTDTGIFYGYVLTTLSGTTGLDGVLAVETNCDLITRYIDLEDGHDTSIDGALVDPFGIVFDSTTGDPINGATVTLWDVTANAPATVLDDFGLPYPSTVTTGDTSLNLPPGGYRFPLIQPGRDYRLIAENAAGYQLPSAELAEILRDKFEGQYVIEDQASYGDPFFINPGPAVKVDIPADPSGGGLWMRKEANRSNVSVGDFLQYTLTLENTDSARATSGVVVEDYLPLGFRYQKGSLEIDSDKAADPQISSDGRTLVISGGNLAPGQTLPITYVVEVAAGAKNGQATNQAVARDISGNRSNLAEESVTVREVFFRNQALLAGQVMIGSCEQEDQDKPGLANARIYLEDGSYVITDKDGRYHFEGIEPGIHVVQLDLDTIPASYEVLPCAENSQFAGRSFSQFVDLQGGTLWRADYYVNLTPKAHGEVELDLSGELAGDKASLRIPLRVGGVPLSDLRLSVILPKGLVYKPKSSTLDGASIPDPDSRGPVYTFRLADRPAGWSGVLALNTGISADSAGDLPIKALLTFNSPEKKNQRTPMAGILMLAKVDQNHKPMTVVEVRPNFPSLVAKLSAEDKLFFDQMAKQLSEIKIERLYAIGHSDDLQVASRSRGIFTDNLALSKARAMNVARYLGDALNLSPDRIVIKGLGDTQPFVDNTTEDSRSLNRRVEIRLEGAGINHTRIIELVKEHSGPQTVETTGLRPGEKNKAATVNEPISSDMPVYDSTWLTTAEPTLEWLWPEDNHVPAIPSIKIAIQHLPEQQVKLLVNGEPASPLAFEGTQSNPTGNVAISTWRGVGIIDGDNQLEAVVSDSAGNLVDQIFRNVHSSYAPVYAEFVADRSILIADGKTVPVIRVALKDRDGYPVREGMVGDFAVNAPYRPLVGDSLEELTLNSVQKIKYKVGPGGIADIRLEPTPQGGEAIVTIRFEEGSGEIHTWLTPAPRDWILVGFAEGTLGNNTFSGNKVSLEEAGIDEHLYDDGQVKFFAKGAIKGEWLMTMAYDSDKPNFDGDSLYQIIDPDAYYPLYGDGTNQGYEASSAHKIYVKLEKNQFYALFGDMHTGLSQTELSRYDRNMSGFKSELQKYNFSYTMFAAETKQAFIKDEIRGEGTSGRYYLSQKELVINSEQVTLETRDRFRSEVIKETQTLQRHIDYDIDYDAGSLFFKRPVPSKDENFDPVIIVVRYETFDSDDENINYGGRAAVKVLNQKVEIGASYVHEERGGGKGDLYGADATVKLAPQTTLHLEAARTENQFLDDDETDDAYLAEISHEANRMKTRAYFREQGEAFGLGQQNLSESGTRKYGAEALYHFTPKFSLAGLVYREEALANNNQRDVAELDARYQGTRYGLNGGFRHAEDQLGDGRTMRSEQILVGGNWFSADTRLKLRADHEQAINGRNKNVDYPTRTIMGADYQINPWVSAFAEQEFTWGDEEDTAGTRVGLNATPWKGGNVSTTVERQMAENSQRVFAIFGLGQTWRINEKWSVDAALDRSYTIKSEDDYQFNENVPKAQGSDEDFTSVSVGATYRKAKWTWWNRLETRQGDNEDKYGASTSVVGEPKDGVAVSAKALAFISEVTGGVHHTDGNIRLGAAYRPTASRWVILNRLDFYFDKLDNSDNDYDNWRIVNNIHANFRVNRKLQMSFYYGLKYVRDNFDGSSYSSFTDMLAFETRYNITKRWDIGVHGSVLHSWNGGQYDYSLGADVGYSPITNTWVSLGYNMVGFEDDDFSAAHYTAQGAYMRIRAKFDQQSVKDAAQWLNR